MEKYTYLFLVNWNRFSSYSSHLWRTIIHYSFTFLTWSSICLFILLLPIQHVKILWHLRQLVLIIGISTAHCSYTQITETIDPESKTINTTHWCHVNYSEIMNSTNAKIRYVCISNLCNAFQTKTLPERKKRENGWYKRGVPSKSKWASNCNPIHLKQRSITKRKLKP